MEKDNARTKAARLLGRLSAEAATPKERKARASKGGKASQAKYTTEQRSERGRTAANVRWEKRRAKAKAKREKGET